MDRSRSHLRTWHTVPDATHPAGSRKRIARRLTLSQVSNGLAASTIDGCGRWHPPGEPHRNITSIPATLDDGSTRENRWPKSMHNGVELYEKRPDGSVKVKLASALTGSTRHKLANTHRTAPPSSARAVCWTHGHHELEAAMISLHSRSLLPFVFLCLLTTSGTAALGGVPHDGHRHNQGQGATPEPNHNPISKMRSDRRWSTSWSRDGARESCLAL